MADSLSINEPAFIQALRAGESSAYERLVRELSGRMLAVARRFMGNDEDAADAVQDAFISAFKALPEFDGRSQLSTWLHRIVVNACLMKLRKSKRRNERLIDDLLPTFLADGHQTRASEVWTGGAPKGGEAAHAGMITADVQAIVRQKIDELPDAFRTILLLRDIEGIDTEQAAQLLGESTSAVKTRLHRARQALKSLLDPIMQRGSL